MQGGNRNADLENGHVNTAGEREVGRNWEIGIAYTLPCGVYTTIYYQIKQIAGGKLLYSTGSSAWSL